MDEKTLWGILIGVYVFSALPLIIKSLDNDERDKARQKFYPGHVDKEEHVREKRDLILNLIWIVGLATLLAAYSADWHPVGTAVLIFGAILSTLAIRFLLKRRAAGRPIVAQKSTILHTPISSSVSQRMHELQKLWKDELISDEEYQKKKQQLLKEI